MSSGARPDSWIYLSDAKAFRRKVAANGSDDSLSEFVPETTPQEIVVPGISASPKRTPPSRVDLHTAPRFSTGSHTPQPQAPRLVASLATRVRRPQAQLINAIRFPLWMGRVRDVRRLATRTTLTAFAGGAAAAVLIMLLVGGQPSVGVQPPMDAMPRTIQAARQEPALPAPDVPSPQDAQPVAEGVRAESTSPPSPIVTTATRPIGTSGGASRATKPAPRPSPPASVASARPKIAAVPPSASYQGSLAFSSAPAGARVFVNGAFVGSTPLVLNNLPVGSRAVRIEADGYQRWSSSTQVVANQQTRVSATLGRAAP
ncbi:MAG TPA: PEGA domain-containing protein [Vicinamibacterales bacterium]